MLDGTAAPGVHPAVIEALAVPVQNRSDATEAMIRREHSRERFARFPLPEVARQPRPAGAVAVQSPTAGRYWGEVTIMLRDLAVDDRVAVVGTVTAPVGLGTRSFTTLLHRCFFTESAPANRPSTACHSIRFGRGRAATIER